MVEKPPRGEWDSFEIQFEEGNIYLINPGSVGQPRDGNAAAAYAILDRTRNTVTLHRVTYDVEKAQRSIRAARLPEFLAERLFEGR
jgi:diadenosine tetraphosphatase ApaH/serine/threonine PP2A family protein phosphatase